MQIRQYSEGVRTNMPQQTAVICNRILITLPTQNIPKSIGRIHFMTTINLNALLSLSMSKRNANKQTNKQTKKDEEILTYKVLGIIQSFLSL